MDKNHVYSIRGCEDATWYFMPRSTLKNGNYQGYFVEWIDGAHKPKRAVQKPIDRNWFNRQWKLVETLDPDVRAKFEIKGLVLSDYASDGVLEIRVP